MKIVKMLQTWIGEAHMQYQAGVRAGRSFGSIALTGKRTADGEFLMQLDKPRSYLIGFKRGLRLRTGAQPVIRHVGGQTFGLSL